MYMRTIGYLMLTFVFSIFFIHASGQSKSKKEMAGYTIDNYELECMGTGMDGSQLIKVWGYGKKPDDAIIQAKRNAVHGVIFKGIISGKPGCFNKPLAESPSVEDKNADYFNEFFKNGGKYLNFIAISGDGMQDRIKVGKQYKVGIVVSVMHVALRKELESAGIVKRLDNGF